MIKLALKFKFAFSILLICEVKLVFLVFIKITRLRRIIYHFIVNNKTIQIIDKAESVRWRTDKAGNKRKEIVANLDNIFAKVYNTMISKIYALLYDIKLGTKFTNVFSY